MWRKTKLEIHYSIYKDSLHAFNVELATTRHIFFSNLINSKLNNTHTLFATVERLTNPPSQSPSEMLSDNKCNEFALIKIINNIRLNSDFGKISVLVLLDLSAAFDSVDHNIPLQRLENRIRLSGMVHKWFRSYLEARGYYVSIGEHKSQWMSMTCRVPQYAATKSNNEKEPNCLSQLC